MQLRVAFDRPGDRLYPGSVTWLIAIVVLVALGALLAIALGFAGRPASSDAEAAALAELAERTGPSGQPFFPDGDAVLDFAQSVEDARDEVRGSGGATSQPAPGQPEGSDG